MHSTQDLKAILWPIADRWIKKLRDIHSRLVLGSKKILHLTAAWMNWREVELNEVSQRRNKFSR